MPLIAFNSQQIKWVSKLPSVKRNICGKEIVPQLKEALKHCSTPDLITLYSSNVAFVVGLNHVVLHKKNVRKFYC